MNLTVRIICISLALKQNQNIFQTKKARGELVGSPHDEEGKRIREQFSKTWTKYLANTKALFLAKIKGGKKRESWSRASLIYFANASHCQNQSILLLWTSFDHQGLNKNWSFFFLPYSCSWQSRVIKKGVGAATRALKECRWYCLPPAVCEVLRDSGDEWVY